MKTIITSILLFAAVNYAAQNNTIETKAVIKNITVYNSSAEINYQKELTLPKGKSTIVFSDLTPFIVKNTMNVGVSTNSVAIITVTEKINYIKQKKETSIKIMALRDSVKRIELSLGLLRAVREALEVEKTLLFKDESIGGVSKGVSVEEIKKASVFFNNRYTSINKELFHYSERENKLLNDLSKYNSHIKEMSSNTTQSCSEIRVTVFNQVVQKVAFSFKFLTPKGGWAPVYDCKFEGLDSPIDFIFRANVFNATGVAWNNVDIKLSTASPTVGFDAPTLGSDGDSKIEKESKGNIQFKEIEVRNTIAEYDIKHKYTIPSDSKPYLVDVDAYKMEAAYHYLLIPKLDAFGFLMAKLPNWNKLNLIPGTTNIYNKGSYMGKTFLNTYAENDTLNLYLGKDNSIVAIKKEKSTTNEQKVVGNHYVDKASINISVKNNSAQSLTIQLLDQVPVFEVVEKIKLNLHGIEQAFYNSLEGSLTWGFQLEPDQTTAINYKFEIKTPKSADFISYKPRRRRFRTISCPAF